MTWIIARLSEPCSYAGLGVVMNALNHMISTGNFFDPVTWGQIGTGLTAFMLPARKN